MPGGRKRRRKASRSRYGKRKAVPRGNEPVPSVPESNGSTEAVDAAGVECVPEREEVNVEQSGGAVQNLVPENGGVNEEPVDDEGEWVPEQVFFVVGEPEPGTVEADPLGRPCFAVEGDVISDSGKTYLVLTFNFLN